MVLKDTYVDVKRMHRVVRQGAFFFSYHCLIKDVTLA